MSNNQAKRVDIVTLRMVKEKSTLYAGRKVSSPQAGYSLVKDFLENLDREALVVVALNSQNEPNNLSIASLGTLDSSPVHPREILKTAVISNASSILVAHNHPGNSMLPSPADQDATQRIGDACRTMGIDLLDHIIVGEGQYYSFKEHGLL